MNEPKSREVQWLITVANPKYTEFDTTTYVYSDENAKNNAIKVLKQFLPKNVGFTIQVDSIVTETRNQETYFIK